MTDNKPLPLAYLRMSIDAWHDIERAGADVMLQALAELVLRDPTAIDCDTEKTALDVLLKNCAAHNCDVYRLLATAHYGATFADVTPTQRQSMKTWLFPHLYGGRPFNFQDTLKSLKQEKR